jgi:hypothetical protein
MTDLNFTRTTVAAVSGVLIAAWFAICMILPSIDRPATVRFHEDKSFARRDEKADRLAQKVIESVPAVIVPEAEHPQLVPRELIEEEKDEKLPPEVPVLPAPVPPLRFQSKADEQPERHAAAKDVCARHGMRKQTYYRHKHESWRCVHD